MNVNLGNVFKDIDIKKMAIFLILSEKGWMMPMDVCLSYAAEYTFVIVLYVASFRDYLEVKIK